MKVVSTERKVVLNKKIQKMFDKHRPIGEINGYIEKLVSDAYDKKAIDSEDYNRWHYLHFCGEIFASDARDWYLSFMVTVGAFEDTDGPGDVIA